MKGDGSLSWKSGKRHDDSGKVFDKVFPAPGQLVEISIRILSQVKCPYCIPKHFSLQIPLSIGSNTVLLLPDAGITDCVKAMAVGRDD